MNFYEAKELGVALAKVLIENGWKVYGLYGDRSDLMVDYYEPAAWDGIAEKNGYVLSFNNRYTQNLDGKMVDNTQTAFGETDESKMVFFPKYQKNPTGSKWHIEKDGEIIAKGRNIGQMYSYSIDRKINGKFEKNDFYGFSEADEKAVANMKKFIEKIEKIVTTEAEIVTIKEAVEPVSQPTKESVDEASNDQPTNESGLEQVISEIEKIEDDGINKEVVGSWIWVSGDTWKHKETLKKLGFKWASKKKMWYYTEQQRKRYGRKEYQMDEIKQKYGSRTL